MLSSLSAISACMDENTIYRQIVQLPSASQAKAVSFSMYMY